jgi:hypothetical protein
MRKYPCGTHTPFSPSLRSQASFDSRRDNFTSRGRETLLGAVKRRERPLQLRWSTKFNRRYRNRGSLRLAARTDVPMSPNGLPFCGPRVFGWPIPFETGQESLLSLLRVRITAIPGSSSWMLRRDTVAFCSGRYHTQTGVFGGWTRGRP